MIKLKELLDLLQGGYRLFDRNDNQFHVECLDDIEDSEVTCIVADSDFGVKIFIDWEEEE